MKLLLSLLLIAAPASAATVDVTIIHTNDIHGWFMSRPDRRKKERRVGGMAAVSNILKKERKAGPVLLLDAGDWYQGTPEATIPRGMPMAELMNELGYDAVAVGNHEFDHGQDSMKTLIQEQKAHVLAANLLDASTGKVVDFVKPYAIVEKGGVRFGIFGLLPEELPAMSFAENVAGFKIGSQVETAKKMVKTLRKKGVDVVIALTHIGQAYPKKGIILEGDRVLRKKVKGIDLIVGGHIHIPIYKPSGSPLIVNSGGYLHSVGKAVISVDTKTRKVVSSRGEIIKLWIDQWGEDEAVLEIVKKWEEKVGRKLDEPVAQSHVHLPKPLDVESPAGSWMTDCMRKWTKTDLAFQNAAGVRAAVPKGTIRLRHIFSVMPFDNRLVTLYMKGSDILGLMERGVGGAPGVLQLSGGRYEWDPKKPVGERISKAWVADTALDKKEVYSVTAADFIVEGGDGYKDFSKGTDKAVSERLLRDTLVWCAKTYSPIKAPEGGRIKKR